MNTQGKYQPAAMSKAKHLHIILLLIVTGFLIFFRKLLTGQGDMSKVLIGGGPGAETPTDH